MIQITRGFATHPSLRQMSLPLLLGPRHRLIPTREDPGVEQLTIPQHSCLHPNGHERDLTRGELLVIREGPERGWRRVERERHNELLSVPLPWSCHCESRST